MKLAEGREICDICAGEIEGVNVSQGGDIGMSMKMLKLSMLRAILLRTLGDSRGDGGTC